MTRVTLACAVACLALPAASSAAPSINVGFAGVDAGGCGTTGLVNQCATINFALTQVDPDGVIRVTAGQFNERVVVPPGLDGVSILGAQQGVDAATRSSTPSSATETVIAPPVADGGSALRIQADDVTIDGVAIVDSRSKPDGSDGPGVFLEQQTSGVRITNSILSHNQFGIYLQSEDGPTHIDHNAFYENNVPSSGAAAGNGIYADTGVNGATINDNKFVNHHNSGVILLSSGTPIPNRNLRLNDNDVSSDRPDASGLFVLGMRGVSNEIEGNSVATNGSALVFGDSSDLSVRGNDLSADGDGYSAIRTFGTEFGIPAGSDVDVVGNNLETTLNGNGIKVGDGSVSDTLLVRHNRIVGNDGDGVMNLDGDTDVDAIHNWWGCNEGPNEPGCDSTSGDVESDPWLVMDASSDPGTVVAPGEADIDVDFLQNSDGDEVPDADVLPAPEVGFAKLSGPGTLADALVVPDLGAASTKLASSSAGTGVVEASADNASDTAEVVFTPQPPPQTITETVTNTVTNTVTVPGAQPEQGVLGDRQPVIGIQISATGLTRARRFCAANNFIAKVKVRNGAKLRLTTVHLDGKRLIGRSDERTLHVKVPVRELDGGFHRLRVTAHFADGKKRVKSFRFRVCG